MLRGKRWRLLCRGRVLTDEQKDYTDYLNLPESQWTKQGSLAAANAWWERKLSQFAAPTLSPEKQEAITDIAKKIDWARRNKPDEVERLERRQDILLKSAPDEVIAEDQDIIEENLRIAELTGSVIAQDTDPVLLSDQYGNRRIWQERFRTDSIVSTEKSISAAIERFQKYKFAMLNAGQLSVGRYDNVRRQLRLLEAFWGGTTLLDAINEKKIRDWIDHVTARIHTGTKTENRPWSKSYARDIFQATDEFVCHCWKQHEIPSLPRNLDELSVSVSDPDEIQTFTNEEITTLLENAKGQMKLHLLLMLNCGFTQKDISDLKKSELNLAQGKIERKRSKTRGTKSVPRVAYKLWECTLKEFRLHLSSDPKLALLNRNGNPWTGSSLENDSQNGKLKRRDGIKSQFDRLRNKIGITKPMKVFRKTSSTRIMNNPKYTHLTSFFLGHASKTTSESYYARREADALKNAIKWLGEQYGLK